MTWQRIYLLRHGETDWNRRNLFRGHSEIGLSERGRAQARAAAAALADRDITAIYTSPMIRSLETARFCSDELGLPHVEAPALSDPDCGLWMGKDLDHARVTHPHEFSMMEDSPSMLRFPEGESVVEVADRVSRFVLRDLDSEAEGSVLLVTHNFIFQVFTMVVLECSLDGLYRVKMDNGAISEYAKRGSVIMMVRMNENGHLGVI